MSKASWKEWPEVQYRFAADDDGLVHIQVRTYTEIGDTLTPYYADVLASKDYLSEKCLTELKDKLVAQIPKGATK